MWKQIVGLFTGGNPIAETIKAIDSVTTSGEERIALKKDFISQVIDAQAKVLASEAASGSWLTQSWRPLVMLSFAAILVYTFFIGPMFDLKVVDLPSDLWTLLQVGIGGYVGGRTVEKLVPMLGKMKKGKE